jgi:voltage-gated potassium channel
MLSQLTIGSALVVVTVLVHGVSLDIILTALRAIGMETLIRWRLLSLSLLVLAVFSAHLIEIWIWAVFYFFIEEIPTFKTALYFSTSSFTTVGYGDLTLSEEWRLLGSMESANGMILFGWSTAFIFTVIHRIYEHLYQPR